MLVGPLGRRLFNERFDPDEPLETADKLTMFARDILGEYIEDTDVGITGANFVAADTGTMALVTCEGHARKSVAVPDMHVAVAGVEKIVPAVRDLHPSSNSSVGPARAKTSPRTSRY